MTKKRFRKLMMAQGCSRNSMNHICELVKKWNRNGIHINDSYMQLFRESMCMLAYGYKLSKDGRFWTP